MPAALHGMLEVALRKSQLISISLCLLAAAAHADLEVVKAEYGSLTLAGYAIARYTYQYGENAAGYSTATSNVALRSASIIFAGDIYKYAGYFIYFDAGATPAVVDAYGDLKVIPGTTVRGGQFLVPFSRESCTSTSKILMVDRALCSVNVAPPQGRDIGLMTEYTRRAEGKNYWGALAAAVVNGSGLNRADENTAKDLALRLMGNPLPWAFTKGVTAEAYYYLGKPAVYNPANPLVRWGTGDETRWGGALGWDHERFSFQSEYLWRKGRYDADASLRRADLSWSRGGAYAEASYKQKLPWPWLQVLEPTARWETYEPNAFAAGDKTTGVTGGVNLHFDPGHHCKLMLNYDAFREEENETPNDRASAQFQVRF